MKTVEKPLEILLVEDNPGDVTLTIEVFRDSRLKGHFHIAHDGVEAMEFLRRQGIYREAVRPDLILLDLNMPRKDGREVLDEVKLDPGLREIPVVVFTSSKNESQIFRNYTARSKVFFISKPGALEQFAEVVRLVENFWFTLGQM